MKGEGDIMLGDFGELFENGISIISTCALTFQSEWRACDIKKFKTDPNLILYVDFVKNRVLTWKLVVASRHIYIVYECIYNYNGSLVVSSNHL